MTVVRRTATTLLLATVVPLGGVALAPVAANAQVARASATCGYPPGHCTIGLNRSTYKAGGMLGFRVPNHAFRPHSRVRPIIDPPHYRHVFPVRLATAAGGLRAALRLPKNAPKGKYTLILRGTKAGHPVRITGSFRIS